MVGLGGSRVGTIIGFSYLVSGSYGHWQGGPQGEKVIYA